MQISHTVTIDFTEEWFAANISFDGNEEAMERLGDIPGAKEWCLNHCCWITFQLPTVDGVQASTFTNHRIKLIEDLIAELPKKSE